MMSSAVAESASADGQRRVDVDAPVNLLGLDRAALLALLDEMGEKPFRASQLLKWVHARRVTRFEDMTDLSRALRERLAERLEIRVPRVVFEQTARDGTRKWLLELDGANAVETVLIPEARRDTLCVSSQVGCALACSFCSTGVQGFNRNLSVAEIIGQLWFVNGILRESDPHRAISNVVFMGMGEPLLNMRSVIPAARLMQDDHAYGLSKRRVTISTSGIVPNLYRLADLTDVSLAVSLHAPTDALRDQLVPINRQHPIAELLAACRHYIADKPHRMITWEYVMLDGVNDGDQQARQLLRLLRGIPSKVNLIPFNPFPETRYRRSPESRVLAFSRILQAGGLTCTVRRTRGEDIDGACGQLVGRVDDKIRRSERRRGAEAGSA